MSFAIGRSNSIGSTSFRGGGFVTLNGQSCYRISDVDRMAPFFVNVVSAYDLWSYMSSRGGLVAGRVSADASLFPYETVDRIHDAHHHTGPVTMMWIDRDSMPAEYWHPFGVKYPGGPTVQRNMYKHVVGNQVTLEEIHEASGLVYQSRWAAADQLGWVRTVTVTNCGDESLRVSFLDGMRNVLPWGLTHFLTQNYSCLTDAYKRSELDSDSNVATFCKTSMISDKANPEEVLRANFVWSRSDLRLRHTLSDSAIEQFQNREPISPVNLLLGQRGNFFVTADTQTLEPGDSLRWDIVLEVGLDHADLAAWKARLSKDRPDALAIDREIEIATDALVRNVASSDGIQQCSDEMNNVHHFSNVLFNNMRGGVFSNNYDISREAFRASIASRNRTVAAEHGQLLADLPDTASLNHVMEAVGKSGDASLQRLAYEYLPIRFSRRHGDPSRPWNRFSISLKDSEGNPLLKYQGNWRDIFQNWESLLVSYPGFLESVISKFVCGSTIDGHNPYRVTDEGLEWEVPEPDQPWANYGYWGDHQIIYLLKLLEAMNDRQPQQLRSMLTQKRFAYLNVPYRLKSYDAIVQDCRDTIDFDFDLDKEIGEAVTEVGEDAKLWRDGNDVIHVNLVEKLLVSMLAKMSNFVLGAGVWMNTQRPEWNDANNALVGNGVSMVTLCYLRRYMSFLLELMKNAGISSKVEASAAVADWFSNVAKVLSDRKSLLGEAEVSDGQRRELLDGLGLSFGSYRERVYNEGPVGVGTIDVDALCEFLQDAIEFSDHTIRLNQREDALYHAYNLIEFAEGEVKVQRLYEMLEGQVAVLSSGCLSPEEAADLLDSMFLSRMYRADQKTFMLYPERELADFADRNVIEEQDVTGNALLAELTAKGNERLVLKDPDGVYRFHADFEKRADVESRLDELAASPEFGSLAASERDSIVELYERVFGHHAYTGRSGTMYGYEGLGCIYWHMVSKLLLAVQENCLAAFEADSGEAAQRLKELYYRVRAGLGPAKTPEEFGAFPMDAYSHTSSHSGARQPGMTGQVKEEVLTRFGELGIRVRGGIIQFRPALILASEFASKSAVLDYIDVDQKPQQVPVPEGGLAFTYCQVPVVYRSAPDEKVVVTLKDGGTVECHGMQLDETLSGLILGRTGKVQSIEVFIDVA